MTQMTQNRYQEGNINLKGKRKPKRLTYGLNDEEFNKLIQVTTNPKHKIAFVLGYLAGLRESEILHLRKDDFDFKNNKLFIRQGKGSKDRIAVIPPPKYFKKNWVEFIPLGISARALRSAFQRLSHKAGFNKENYKDSRGNNRFKYSFHSLRSGYATKLFEKGIDPHHIQIVLGHSELATTLRYVKGREEDALKKIMEINL